MTVFLVGWQNHPLSLSLSFKPTLIGSFKSRLFYLDENSWLTREKLFPDSCQMR